MASGHGVLVHGMGNLHIILLVLWSCGIGSVDGTLRLTPFPAAATEGNLYTLVCTSSSLTVSRSTWYRDDAAVLETNYSNTSTRCDTVVLNNGGVDSNLEKRVDTTCGIFQHNVTLRINSSKDNRTVWRCKDTDDTSNTLTIDVTDEPPATTSSPQTTSTTDAVSSSFRDITDTASTAVVSLTSTQSVGQTSVTSPEPDTASTAVSSLTSTQSVGQTTVTSPEPENELPIIYIAVAGGVAVVIIIVIVVSVVVIRRRKAHTVKLGEDGNVVKTTEV